MDNSVDISDVSGLDESDGESIATKDLLSDESIEEKISGISPVSPQLKAVHTEEIRGNYKKVQTPEKVK